MIIEQVVYSSKGRILSYPATIVEKALSVYIRESMTEDQVKKEFRDSYPALLPAWVPPVKFKPKCGPGKTVRRMLRDRLRRDEGNFAVRWGRSSGKSDLHYSNFVHAIRTSIEGSVQESFQMAHKLMKGGGKVKSMRNVSGTDLASIRNE